MKYMGRPQPDGMTNWERLMAGNGCDTLWTGGNGAYCENSMDNDGQMKMVIMIYSITQTAPISFKSLAFWCS